MTSNIYKNVLFIDEQVPQHDIFKDACKDDTLAVIYNRDTTRVDTLLMLREKFSTENGGVGIERVGFVFHGTHSAPAMFLNNSEMFDTSSPDAINENTQFLIEMIKEFGVKNMDFLACNTLRFQEWKDFYALLLAETGVKVGASDDDTGNMKYGGDWVMESTNEDVETVYFTSVIDGYKYLLGIGFSTTFIVSDGYLHLCGRTYNLLQNNDFNGTILTPHKFENMNNIKQISCSGLAVMVLKNDGTLWACGENISGMLGISDGSYPTVFTQITTNVSQVSCGASHTMIIKNDGTLWGCGRDTNGALGTGVSTNYYTFTQIMTNVSQVSCGASHTMIIKNDGTLWGCGLNMYGLLGLGDETSRTTFTQITTNVSQVVSGYYYTMIIKTDGTLWGCGDNNSGQLGLGDTTKRTTFTQITTNVSQVQCAYAHALIIKNDRTLWGSGRNSGGQLGLGDTINRTVFTQIMTNVLQVCCDETSSLLCKRISQKWYSCGDNYNGNLVLGDKIGRNTFTEITLLDKITLINETKKLPILLTGISGQSINSTGSYSELTDFALNASAASKKLTISNFSLTPLPADFNIPGKNVVSYELTDGTNTETVEYIM